MVMTVGILYSMLVPFVSLCAAVYFYVAERVYMHQALYVNSPEYEGGGNLMYFLSKYTFYILYLVDIVYYIYVRSAGGKVQSYFFIFLLLLIVHYQKKIQNTYVNPSRTLSYERARKIDKENNMLTKENVCVEDWAYCQPCLESDRLNVSRLL
mmetsp:Transcript_28940/g.66262  ORF Transcript_28940/g.66262 Transcript_28940/m.66262 type:complete len:153 (-) Transcript_28940:142-600(-)